MEQNEIIEVEIEIAKDNSDRMKAYAEAIGEITEKEEA